MKNERTVVAIRHEPEMRPRETGVQKERLADFGRLPKG